MKSILEYKGLKLEIEAGVYEPSDDSYLLAENLKVKSGDLVLELGTGCGLIALLAAKSANKVIATDISPIAVKCARHNVRLNQAIAKVEVRLGDLFDPIRVGEKFDIILFNPPYLPENRKKERDIIDWVERAWDGGVSGRKIIDPFIRTCKKFLNSGGLVQMVQSSLSDIANSHRLFQAQEFQVNISAQRTFFFEKIVLLDARLK